MKILGILDHIEFKGNKTNILLKWVIAVAGSAIVGAFVIGQVNMTRLNKLGDIEALAKQGIEATAKLEAKVDANSKKTDAKIDKIYSDGMDAFEDYRLFNNEQFKLIIDYGETNKELLKRMLELNSQERARQIEADLQESKREEPTEVKNPTPREVVFTEVETGKAYYFVGDAPENFLDTLNLNKFEITNKEKSKRYPELYDFEYKDK